MNKPRVIAIGTTIASLLVSGISAGPVLEDRQAGCAHDNLLRALLKPDRTAEAASFCNDYLCRPSSTVTATVTGSAHPLYLYNLQPYVRGRETPLTYPSPPTPSTIPGNAACYAWPEGVSCPYPPTRKRTPAPDAPAVEARRQSAVAANCPTPTLPSFLAATYPASRLSSACSCALPLSAPTTTTTCTSLGATWPTTTIPAFCAPSFHVNRASLLPLPPSPTVTGVRTATATLGLVSDKLDCCVSCAGIYNCVAWSYVPFPSTTATGTATAHTGDASDQGPEKQEKQKINPWISGMCVAVYNYGVPVGSSSSSSNNDNAAAVCPNGMVGELLDGGSNNPSPDGAALRWENLYYNGWNEGPCGRPLNVFQSGQDGGRGDYDTICQG